MNSQKIRLNIFAIVLIAIGLYFASGTLLVLPFEKIFGQSTTSSTSSTVQISKDLTNSYTISSGSSKIGSFDTKYTILGNINALNQEQKLIISTVTTDFDNSPIVGYVKASLANNPQQQNPTLGNPFADKTTINQKIGSLISNALTSTSSLNTAKAAIECNFGMSISQWTCKSHGLVG
jgi:hypothetical protein